MFYIVISLLSLVILFILFFAVPEELYRYLRGVCDRNAAFLEVQVEYLSTTPKTDDAVDSDLVFDPATASSSSQQQQQVRAESAFPLHGVIVPYVASFINHSCACNVLGEFLVMFSM